MLEESYGDSCEEPYFKDPFERLFEDMFYEEGMHDDEFFLEEEDMYEEEPSVRPCETLMEESNVKPLVKMASFKDIHIDHKEDQCLMEETYDEKCLMEKACDEESLMEETYENRTWQNDGEEEQSLMKGCYVDNKEHCWLPL